MESPMTRRRFLGTSAAGAAGILRAASVKRELPKATADTCIFIWLAGGMCHVDTFDPKPKGDGGKVPGGYFNAIRTAVPAIEVCEHLPRVAARMDRCAILRTLHHDFPNHSTAVDFVHTGRVASGTIEYPSVGSMVAHELGGFDPKAPAYVVVGYPMKPRGPGFLGGRYNYIYVTDSDASPAGLKPPDNVSTGRYQRRLEGLRAFTRSYVENLQQNSEVVEYEAAAHKGFEMMGEKFQRAFMIKDEPASLREAYGEEFGQRLLLSRRLVEHGIRFVECSFNLHFINGYGWDTHEFAQQRVDLIIRQLDRGLAALMDDMERRKMLDRTLVVIGTDFGRPPDFDGGGGRGHQSTTYSSVILGGGVKGGMAVGVTDALGREIRERPISIPDWHATIHRALGIDPEKPLMTPDNRPVPITDYGKPVEEILS